MPINSDIKDALELATALAQDEFKNNPPIVDEKIICPNVAGILTIVSISETRLRCVDSNLIEVSVSRNGCYRLDTLMRVAAGELWEEHFLPGIDLSNILK